MSSQIEHELFVHDPCNALSWKSYRSTCGKSALSHIRADTYMRRPKTKPLHLYIVAKDALKQPSRVLWAFLNDFSIYINDDYVHLQNNMHRSNNYMKLRSRKSISASFAPTKQLSR